MTEAQLSNHSRGEKVIQYKRQIVEMDLKRDKYAEKVTLRNRPLLFSSTSK